MSANYLSGYMLEKMVLREQAELMGRSASALELVLAVFERVCT